MAATFFLLLTSNPCNGSSKIIRSGSFTNARAKSANLCSPEESVRKERSFNSSIPNTRIQAKAICCCLLRTLPEQPDRVKEIRNQRYSIPVHSPYRKDAFPGKHIRCASLYPKYFLPTHVSGQKDKACWHTIEDYPHKSSSTKSTCLPRSDRTTPTFSPFFTSQSRFFQDGTATIFDRNVFHPESNEMGGRFFLILNRK